MYNRQLDAFVKSAELHSFSKAARELYITPASLIQQINLLESNLGVVLFHRSKKGVTLTVAGESLFDDAQNIIHLSQIATERIQAIGKEEENIVKVGTSLFTKCRYLTDIWYQTINTHPGLKIELIQQNSLEEMTANPMADMGNTYDLQEGIFFSGLYGKKCNFLELFPARVCIAVPKKHPLFFRHALSLQDLHEEKIILGRRGHSNTFDQVRDFFKQEVPTLEIIDVDYYDIHVFTTCELNRCLILSLDVWSDIHPSLKTFQIDWEFTIPYGLIYSLCPPKSVQALLDTAHLLIEKNFFNVSV